MLSARVVNLYPNNLLMRSNDAVTHYLSIPTPPICVFQNQLDSLRIIIMCIQIVIRTQKHSQHTNDTTINSNCCRTRVTIYLFYFSLKQSTDSFKYYYYYYWYRYIVGLRLSVCRQPTEKKHNKNTCAYKRIESREKKCGFH